MINGTMRQRKHYLEHYQSTDATIAVLKRMYRLEALMEIKDVFHGYRFL